MKREILEDIASEPYAARGDDASNLFELEQNLKNLCSQCLKKGCKISLKKWHRVNKLQDGEKYI